MTTTTRPSGDTPEQMSSRLRSFLLRQEVILLIISLLAVMFLAFGSDRFLTANNLLNQGRLLTEIGLVALSMTFIIITGGIDLSVGSILGLCAIVLGVMWDPKGAFAFPLEVAVLICLLVGIVAGFVNGLIIVRLGVPPYRAPRCAAAHHHTGDAGALSRAGGRDQPGAFSARLSGRILCTGSGGVPGRADAALGTADLLYYHGSRPQSDGFRACYLRHRQ